MDTKTYIAWYTVLVAYGSFASFAVFVGYTLLAPWYKHIMGRLVWALFLAITLVLSVSIIRLVIGDFPFRMELALGTFTLFNLVVTLCGYGIYTAQIRGYIKKKAQEKKLKKLLSKDQ